ncbi:sporulation histidine kinase inhibitor Sda [Bacillus sp. EB600]|nr:sporulation histidine kinase inhibitor Sda [Bacillus sp. EB600]MCQ6277749.1 sporulation histidine kinase inhibitor Sda [Bacillus sp. EB600]
MKIMSNEQLIVSYRDALKSGKEKEWIRILKDEIVRRGLTPIKERAMNT